VVEKMIIRNFTSESRQIYRLSHDDIGPSLLNVACSLNYRGLCDDVRRAAEPASPLIGIWNSVDARSATFAGF